MSPKPTYKEIQDMLLSLLLDTSLHARRDIIKYQTTDLLNAIKAYGGE